MSCLSVHTIICMTQTKMAVTHLLFCVGRVSLYQNKKANERV